MVDKRFRIDPFLASAGPGDGLRTETATIRGRMEFGSENRGLDMPGSAGIVSINVIYPRQGYQERALAALREVLERVRVRRFGLVRSRLYRSLDGRTLATHAEWRSKSQHDAALRDDEFVRRFNRLREFGIFESHVYEIADDVYEILPVTD